MRTLCASVPHDPPFAKRLAQDVCVGGAPDSGDVRGETSNQLPPPFGEGSGGGESAAGTSLWVAIALMVLAALAGFATPTLKDRLRGPSRTSSAG